MHQGRSGRVRKISPPPGFDPRTAQPVASRYTDCATTVHLYRHLRQETRYLHEEPHPSKLFFSDTPENKAALPTTQRCIFAQLLFQQNAPPSNHSTHQPAENNSRDMQQHSFNESF
jgi:hypothetical protein